MDEVVKLVEGELLGVDTSGLGSQIVALYLVVMGGGTFLYLFLASLSYLLFFKLWKQHYHPNHQPQPYKGQVQDELAMSIRAIPTYAHLTVPFLLLEINGYSKLYNHVSEYGWTYWGLSIVVFLLWSDFAIYFIHRGLHEIPWAYKTLHKEHHKWKVPTPFASIAFHPVDGWLQSVPYHLFPFFVPMHKWLSLALFVVVQVWTVLIHDGVDFHPLSIVNGAAHHTFHHSHFRYNYGQYFVFWDRICGSYLSPYSTFDPTNRKWVSGQNDAKHD